MRHLMRAVVAMLAALAAVLTGPAALAADEIGFSADGTRWTEALGQPLFPAGFRWIPGDTETRSFYVRNQGPTPATMAVTMETDDIDALLADGDFAVRGRAGDGSWQQLTPQVVRTDLLSRSIPRGGSVRIDVEVAFVGSSPNRSQRRRLPLDFRVRLSGDGSAVGGEIVGDTGAGDGDTGANGALDDDTSAGALPATGSTLHPAVPLFGFLLLGGGLWLVLRRGTSTKETTDE